jgi:DNA uptake protein and related DNA-binding proteins
VRDALPYRILLGITVVVSMLAVGYNFNLREQFEVTVGYTYPQELLTPQDLQDAVILEQADDAALDEWQQEKILLPDPASVSFPLELNRATREELMLIPGIGETTSRRIVQYRDVLGGYTDLEQLYDIKGIGKATFDKISAYLYLFGDDWDAQRQTTSARD